MKNAEGLESVRPAPQPDDDALVGTTINGKFELKHLIAAGGMGRVYAAVQHPLGRIVAIKVLRLAKTMSGDTKWPEDAIATRFLREASVLAKLNNRHVVMLHDYGRVESPAEYSGVYFMAMEHLGGRRSRRRSSPRSDCRRPSSSSTCGRSRSACATRTSTGSSTAISSPRT
jgi:serine/threonine-protein kinase